MGKTFKDNKTRPKIRRSWGQMNPATIVRDSDKGYDRREGKRDWKQTQDWEDENSN